MLRPHTLDFVVGVPHSLVSNVLPVTKELKPGCKIISGGICERPLGFEKKLARSLGFTVQGLAPIMRADDSQTVIEGAKKRLVGNVPFASHSILRKFRSFVRYWLKHNLVPLKADTDFSLEHWLDGSKYPEWRKKEIRENYVGERLLNKHFRNKSFIKRECYPQIKHARWINSRHDAFKAYTGPYFAQIEHEVFKLPHFVKYVPVLDRANYIYSRLHKEGYSYVATDHTSFEAHITKSIMKVCEIQLYSYMLKNVASRNTFLGIVKRALLKDQYCVGRSARVIGSFRASGDMCTSLGNGFTNLMVMSFLAWRNGWKECVGVIEGDDGLFRLGGRAPSSEDFKKLGFDVKMEVYDTVSEAGFCGIYFAGKHRNLIDPIWAILKSGYTMSQAMSGNFKTLNGLAKLKAYSLACLAPSTPVVCSLIRYILRCTHGFAAYSKWQGWWETIIIDQSTLDGAILSAFEGPTFEERLFVSRKWGLDIGAQFEIEKYFDGLSKFKELDNPILVNECFRRFPQWSIPYMYCRR